MDNVRREFIIELLETLKVPSGVFNVGTVSDEIKHIPDTSLRAFHKALFGTSHSYLNGMDRIIKVAELFKPVQIDEAELKAKELIMLVESMNDTVFDNAKVSGRTFEDELSGTVFIGIDDNTMAILNNVKPYMSIKALVAKVNHYATYPDQLRAFKNALEYPTSNTGMIESTRVKNLIGRKR